MAYTAGRCWIEMLRIDDAHRVLGLRLNVWTSLLVFALGVLVFVIAGRLGARHGLSPRRLRITRTEKAKTCTLAPVNPMLTMLWGPA